MQVSADQQEAEVVKRNVALEEREVKKIQREVQVRGQECACITVVYVWKHVQ